MKIERLFIKNFECHEKSYIDFNLFSSILIVGRIENNDAFSNSVGKSAIFRAIEFGFFNESDGLIDDVVKEDEQQCVVTIDFTTDNKLYRLERIRTNKGNSNISLFENVKSSTYEKNGLPFFIEDDWKNISGSRNQDADKQISSLIKIDIKSFRNTAHFIQDERTGLANLTPEKRKSLLKDILSLDVYKNLEKIVKEDIAKKTKLAESMELSSSQIESILSSKQNFIDTIKENKILIEKENINLVDLKEKLKEKEDLYNNLYEKSSQQRNINTDLNNKISLCIKTIDEAKDLLNIESKNKDVLLQSAKDMSLKIKSNQENLDKIVFDDLSVLEQKYSDVSGETIKINLDIQNILSNINKLSTPLPNNSICDHCRQVISKDHLESCKKSILLEIEQQKNVLKTNKDLLQLKNKEKDNLSELIKQQKSLLLLSSKLQSELDILKERLSVLKEKYGDKKNIIEALQIKISNIENEKKSLEGSLVPDNDLDLSALKNDLAHINNQIIDSTKKVYAFQAKVDACEQEVVRLDKSIKDIEDTKGKISELKEKIRIDSLVLEAFSSTGIPNLIIQELLNDIENKANGILLDIKPTLQLSFVINKENKKTKIEEDTLDIVYFINGKKRKYYQLSGAMKLAIMFSLKLALSELLQSISGANIEFLLLDEVEPALDKAGVDAFADMIKKLQNEYKILVITHNERLQEKFQHFIVVEQNKQGSSKALVSNKC